MTSEQTPDPETRRLLRKLAAPGAWIAIPPPSGGEADPDGALCLSLHSRKGASTNLPVSPKLVREAADAGWIVSGEGRMTLSRAGAASLRRALSSSPDEPARPHDRPVGIRRPSAQAATRGRVEPTERTPGIDEAESPLGWLRRRKDKSGAPLISDAQFAAGERLRADVFFAGLSGRVTMDWGRTGGAPTGRGATQGGSASMLDNMVAARQRVDLAMRAVGPEMSGILLDVCGFLKGLETVEIERGWPARSGKIVLLHALSMLARHYGIDRADRRSSPNTRSGRVRHWGADDFRPDASAWDETPDSSGETAELGGAKRH